mmetsp:Transcript_3749/g.9093  ORF Transcript_3749/g.9093 Transcript_3749/m.9093 type:complete len:667 (-) Transcript_3749:379-2379(-)
MRSGEPDDITPVGPVHYPLLPAHMLVPRLVIHNVVPGRRGAPADHRLVVDEHAAHHVRLVTREDQAVDPRLPEVLLNPVVLLARARSCALRMRRGDDADVNALVNHLLQRLQRARERLHRAVEPWLGDDLKDLVALLEREVALDLELGAAADDLLVLRVLRQPPLAERPVPVRDHHVHVHQHRLCGGGLGRQGGVDAGRSVRRRLLHGHGGWCLGGHLVDELHVRRRHRLMRELPEHARTPFLAHGNPKLVALLQLVDRIHQRLGVLGGHQEALLSVGDRLGEAVDVRGDEGAAESLSLRDHQRQHLVLAGHEDDVGGQVKAEHVLVDVHDGCAVHHAPLLKDLLHLRDIVDLVLADVARADDEQLRVLHALLVHELGERLGRHVLALARAHRPEMEHQEVVVGVPELRADRLAVLLLLELVDGRDGDAVVNDLARCLVDEPVVELHLDLGGEADVAAPGLGALERLLDDAGVDALLHEDLGRVPVELVLRPRLVDHPRVRHAQFLGGADHRGAHDGVGEHGAEVRELLLEAHHVARVARLHDVHLHAELLEVLAHRALGGRVELEGLAVERGHVLEQDKHEDVGAVALERVREARDMLRLVLGLRVLLDRRYVGLDVHVHELRVLAESCEDIRESIRTEPIAMLLLGVPQSLKHFLMSGRPGHIR